MKNLSKYLIFTFLVGALAITAGCERDGPAERAGHKIDKTSRSLKQDAKRHYRNAKDKVNGTGPAEKAGRKLDDATGN